jgi:hypothetical protein
MALSIADHVLHVELEMAYRGVPLGEGGALHHIGTWGGRRAWSNPHEAGLVTASMSLHCDLFLFARKLVGRGMYTGDTGGGELECRTRTPNVANSWMAVDLGPERTMRVAHYCLRHGSDHAGDELRNWELQARAGVSRQGVSEADGWTTLRRHEADASLQGGDSVAAFAVTQHTGMAFRYFRLHQHGINATGRHFLVCGGLELYGTLLDGATY